MRELVFVATLRVVLPSAVLDRFPDKAALDALLIFLGFMLRLWTIMGELMLVGLAYLLDRSVPPGLAATSEADGRPV